MEVNAEEFQNRIIEADKPVFALFLASWCTACKRSQVTVRELEKERDDILVLEINVDRNDSVRDELNILGVPTFILFKDGKEVERRVAAQAKRQLNSMIDEYV